MLCTEKVKARCIYLSCFHLNSKNAIRSRSVTSRPFMYGILNDGATNEPTNRGNKLVICLFKWLRLCFMRLFEYHNNYSKFNAKHLYTNYHFSLLPFHLSILSIYNQRPLLSLPQASHIQTGPINSHFLPFFQKKKEKNQINSLFKFESNTGVTGLISQSVKYGAREKVRITITEADIMEDPMLQVQGICGIQ